MPRATVSQALDWPQRPHRLPGKRAGGGVVVPPAGPRQGATHRQLHSSPGLTSPDPGVRQAGPGTPWRRSPGPPSSLGLPATQLPGPAPEGSPRPAPGAHLACATSPPSRWPRRSWCRGSSRSALAGLPAQRCPRPLGEAKGSVRPCPAGATPPTQRPSGEPRRPVPPGAEARAHLPVRLPLLGPRSHCCPQSLPLTLVPIAPPAPWA